MHGLAWTITIALTWGGLCTANMLAAAEEPRKLDFNQDIRPILSNKCFQCHGPDEAERKGGGVHGLRLDNATGAQEDLGGFRAIVPGDPVASLLIQRITSNDPEALMPPPDSGKSLTPAEIERLTEWVRQGGQYARHWSYEPPVRPKLPNVSSAEWNRNAVDRFLWSRLEREGLTPQPEADRFTLIRRMALDLTGLPPTVAEVDEFVNDTSPDAYEHLVDRLLKKPTYGEHWARLWLDLARYADSAGYADDPSRTIWAYRDYVIRAFQKNTPFDQFTLEQLAGDLLPEAGEDQLIATAFHRNTLTNNEGGTNDEEFRNVAIVDRVNTTFAVWMGTTINCAQCHSHKFDPITQEEFFQVFAILNQSEDADRRDESPLYELWMPSQLEQKRVWQTEIASLQRTLASPTPELAAAQREWEASVPRQLDWQTATAAEFQATSGSKARTLDDQSLLIETTAKTDSYSVTLGVDRPRTLSALRLEVLPDPSLPGQGPGRAGGNFVLSRVSATSQPTADQRVAGRFVRIEIPGSQKILSLAEVQVYSDEANVALQGQAEQSTTDYDGPAKLANDGNTDGRYFEAKSTTHSAVSDNPWWEVDLQTLQPIDRIVIWNRTDGDVGSRLSNFQLSILDADRRVVWQQMIVEPPKPQGEYAPSGIRGVTFATAFADYSQPDFAAAFVTADPKDAAKKGWAIGGQAGQRHELVLIPTAPIELVPESRLVLKLDQHSTFEDHVIGRFRLSWTENTDAARFAEIPASIIGVLQTPAAERTPAQAMQLEQHYRGIARLLKEPRERLAVVSKQLNDIKPATTVPVMRDLAESQRRKTNIQLRGNWQNLGAEVAPGVPAAFHAYEGPSQPNRLELAKWLVDRRNPLTARVMVNRLWEQIFGIGIVSTSEEFGSQGEPPVHPELLDWLAVEFMDSGWNWQHMLKLVATSAAYKQASLVTPEIQQRDPENRLLARGPRFRMSAEMIRDQALSVSGLLSPKQFGPPVRPLQPKMGVNAAFGSAVDWQTSDGEDRHRRALYTTWRRSNPYPSMATFDAPNREVCALRRERTNTPLQALVTLNDPVYIECAQSLARQMLTASADPAERIRFALRQALGRPAKPIEIDRLLSLHDHAREKLTKAPEQARKLATVPLGAAPEGTDVIDLAAWTVVANAILNLDEMFMRR